MLSTTETTRLEELLRSASVAEFNALRRKHYESEEGYACLRGIELNGKDISRANMGGLQLREFTILSSTADYLNFRGCWIDNLYAYESSFAGTDWRGAGNLGKFRCERNDFSGNDFRDAWWRASASEQVRDFFLCNTFTGATITPQQATLLGQTGIPPAHIAETFKVLPRSACRTPKAVLVEKGLRAHEQAQASGAMRSCEYEGHVFSYAIVPVEGNEDLLSMRGHAFCVSRDVKDPGITGSPDDVHSSTGYYCVFDATPERFRGCLATHEFVEHMARSHIVAVGAEYEYARANGILNEYVAWLLKNNREYFIRNQIPLLAEEIAARVPEQVKAIARSITHEDMAAWRQAQRRAQHGVHADLWIAAWRGGNPDDTQLVRTLNERGYTLSMRDAREYREMLEIPDSTARAALTYLEPKRAL